MKLRCSRVIVTGGTSGIGLAIAKRLAAAGALVLITGRNSQRLNSALEMLGMETARALLWDVADARCAAEKLRQAEDILDGLDGLVNNAGVSSEALGRGYEPWDITPDEWDEVMDTNLRGAFFLTQAMVNLLMDRGRKGNILNVASNAACMDITGPYGLSKLGLARLTHGLSKRFGAHGIIINAVAPGATFTPMIAHYAKHPDDPYARHAIGRFLRPEEIAELAFFLMSESGEGLCGHTVVADGGDRCTAW